MRSNPRSEADVLLASTLVLAGVVIVGGGAVVELAALLAGQGATHLTVSSLAAGLLHWHNHPEDPRLAFSAPIAAHLPGAVGMYAAVGIVAAVSAAVGLVSWMIHRKRLTKTRRPDERRHRDGLASPRMMASAFPVGIAGGLTVATPLPKGKPIVVPHERSVGALMAPRTGKSSSAVIHILDAPGAVLATSSKRELLLATAVSREQSTGQPTLTFDPMEFCGWDHPIRWSPISGCERPEVAMRRAEALMAGTSTDNVTNGGFWNQRRPCCSAASCTPAPSTWPEWTRSADGWPIPRTWTCSTSCEALQ